MRLLALVLVFAAATVAQTPFPVTIGFRYDDQRVLFFYREAPWQDPNWRLVSQGRLPLLPKPSAPNQAGPLAADPAGSPEFPKGRRFEVLLGGSRRATVEVESYVMQAACTALNFGVIARVVEGAAAYREETRQHYLIREPGMPDPALVPSVPLSGVLNVFDRYGTLIDSGRGDAGVLLLIPAGIRYHWGC